MKNLARHVIIELSGCKHTTDLARIERAVREAVEAARVSLRDLHVWHWTPNDGVSVIAVLAESHLSVHTWPEHDYAAIDIFTCGETAIPEAAIEPFERCFNPAKTEVLTLERGPAKLEDRGRRVPANHDVSAADDPRLAGSQ